MPYAHYFTAFVLALAVSAGSMPGVIRIGRRFGAVDRPGGRRVHSNLVPRIGGIGIFLGFVAGVGAAMVVAGRSERLSDPTDYNWVGLGIGMLVIFSAGLLDDLYGFRAQTKLLLQIVAAIIPIASGFWIQEIGSPFGGVYELGWLGPWATLAWILLVTNAMNLIDGLDGLAGGLALIVTATVATVALMQEQFGVVTCAVALAGALVGFLRFNFGAPARVFMGDGGSQFLGYTLAVIAVRGAQKGATAVAVIVPLLLLGLPIMDVTTTIARRVRRDRTAPAGAIGLLRTISRPDREHLHHNLLDLGLTPRRAALFLHLIAALFALSAYLWIARHNVVVATFVLVLPVGAVALIKWMIAGSRSRERGQHPSG